jgi:hypothetical protein
MRSFLSLASLATLALSFVNAAPANLTTRAPNAPHFVVYGDKGVQGSTGAPPVSDIEVCTRFVTFA